MTKNYITLDMELSGKRLHAAMIRNGYSVKQLQEKLFLSCPHVIYRWINGLTLPSVDNLYKLSRILNIQMEDLLVAEFENDEDITKNYITLNKKLSGKKIHTAITRSGYSIVELQKMLHLSHPQQIYRWINGLVLPSVDNLYRLSRILDTKMEDLLVAGFMNDEDITKNYITLDKELSGKKIHTAITKSGYSIAKLQEMLHLSHPQQIYRWINGLVLPSVDNLYRLSRILDTKMENLIGVKNNDNIL